MTWAAHTLTETQCSCWLLLVCSPLGVQGHGTKQCNVCLSVCQYEEGKLRTVCGDRVLWVQCCVWEHTVYRGMYGSVCVLRSERERHIAQCNCSRQTLREWHIAQCNFSRQLVPVHLARQKKGLARWKNKLSSKGILDRKLEN